jgi:hypothetical protein
VVTDFTDASSLLPLAAMSRHDFALKEQAREKVDVVRLDDIVKARKLPWPDLIKLDVQGYELEVLKGAADAIQHAKAAILEVSFVEYYQGQCFFDGVVEHMAKSGFLIYAFGVNTLLGRPIHQTDVLFVA